MASLDRMAFRGIRSFDEKQINMISFFSPLTVIVGTNGSGKTTIIECLKYSTTGDLPPNSKGGAFLHDPGMAMANEVKAQVRLRFYNTNKVRINCIRNLQVTRKKTGGLTMKTLEAILQVDDPAKADKRTVLSTKCAEVDEEMPAALGVSRAILDNVIFCHQEDNNWPLGEPASLKKKFDDIFEATRYTKALDNIKSLRRERAVTLKVGKAELEGLKTDRQRADSVKDKKAKLEQEMAEKTERLERLNADLEELTISNKELYDKAVRFRETVQKAEGLEDKKQMYAENLTSLYTSMTELTASEEELKSQKDGFDDHLTELKRKQDDLKAKIAGKKGDIEESEKLLNKRLSEHGALQSEKESHERALQRRTDVMRKVSAELELGGVDGATMTVEEVHGFSNKVEEEAERLRRSFEQLKAELARREDDCSKRLQEQRNACNSKEAKRAALQDDIRRLKERIKRMRDDLDASMTDAADVETAKKEHAAQSSRLQDLTQEQSEARYDDKVREKNTEIRALDDQREQLTSELNSLNRQADYRAKLDISKKAAAQKNGDVEALLLRNSELLSRVLGNIPSSEHVESDVEEAATRKEKELAGLEGQSDEAKAHVQQLESAYAFALVQVEEKRSEADMLRRQIDAALEGEYESLDDAVKQCSEEIEYAKSQIALYESMSSFIKNLEAHVKDKRVCLGCNRSIAHDEMSSIEVHIADMVQKAQPAKLQGYRDDASSWEEQLTTFQNLKPKEARWLDLVKFEINKHEEELKKAAEEMKSAKAEAGGALGRLEACKAELREIVQLKKVANDVVRFSAEKAQLDRDISALQGDLRSSGSTRTGDEVQEEIDGCAETMKKHKREVMSIQQEKEAVRVNLTNQERAVHRAEMALARAVQEKERFRSAQGRLDEANMELEEQNGKLKDIQADLEAESAPLQRTEDELGRVKAEASSKQISAQRRVGQAVDLARLLRDSVAEAHRFVEQHGQQRLRSCQVAIEELQESIQDMRCEVALVQTDVNGIEKDLNESRATERNISDNLRYIHLQRETRSIDAELREMDLEEASRANREWDSKYNASKRAENDMNGRAAHLNGEITGLRAQIDARKRELREEYKDVHKLFTHKLIEVKTSELAQSDLEHYQTALNSAIMRFHSIKMEEINETLNDLWSKTYKGSDIDTIKVRADGESVGGRSYNYRVVMVKNNIEMDMRGRCSAGQKCLASILIRLALSDSFSENCGVMALDEPTTNLDEHNIHALAASLGALIEDRRQQSNFQLIIITHDVNFLSQIAHTSGGIEKYFRVERDEHYRSRIIQETQLP